MNLSPETIDSWVDIATTAGLNVLLAAAILVAGWIVARWAGRAVGRLTAANESMDKTISMVLVRLVRIAILAFTFIAVLNRFGIQTTSIVALLGAAGLAVGLALQGSLSNVASGVMILGLRPFKVGDAVDIGGSMGVVEDIGLFLTRLKTFDGVPVYMPNSQVFGSEIKNFTSVENRRIDLIVGIGYGDDMQQALDVLKEVVAADERVLDDPEPVFGVDTLGDSSVNLLGRFWVPRADFLAAKMELTQRVKEAYDEAGIEIPFPQRDLHIIQDGDDAIATRSITN